MVCGGIKADPQGKRITISPEAHRNFSAAIPLAIPGSQS
jgi:hypothetical protein